jgi:hypothetical protein
LKNTADVVAFCRRRARSLNDRIPGEAARTSLASTGHPQLAAAADRGAAALRIVANPLSSDQLVLSTLSTVRQHLEDYASSDEESGNDSDCTRGCDENLQICLEHWVTVLTGDDFSLDPPDDQEQTPGTAGGIDDNPLDVENNDAGDGTGLDDDETSGSGHEVQVVVGTEVFAAASALCMIEFVVCNAACLIPG